ncbi:ABC transporter permease [Rhizobium sp. XQZ8]|uniref:ABC transporter permease n=1 Tax=Rhizobium populisoli TaxID=2859785 RepID=UPI001C669F77|nr:ABC transporter permease [Rhizobium populisoli]MBW6422583.1 ABC transporter permease [Rhizobium populisoli]
MLTFFLKKLPSVVMVAIASSVIAFVLPRLAPGDPAVALAGSDASPEQLAAVRDQLGLNGSLYEQYFHWIWNLLHGDLGRSFAMRRPVATLISSRLESTIELAALALVLMIIIGFTLGILSATLRNQTTKAALDVVNTICLATPPFLTGLLLILLLGIAFPILPVSGEMGLLRDPVKGLQYLILPAFALALPQAAVVARLLATAINSVRGEDFIDLAKAKGVPPGRLMRRHLLRNSLGPAIVAIGLRAGELLGGAIVIEAIFARNGLGQLAVSSVQNRDYLVLQALILGAVLIAVLIQLLSEITIAALDPRIRLEG